MAIVYQIWGDDTSVFPKYTSSEKEAAAASMKGQKVSMMSGDWFPMKLAWTLSVDHQGGK